MISNNLLFPLFITVHLHFDSIYATNPLKKKVGEILIEQFIEFQLKGPGPLGRKCTPKTVYFHGKKILQTNLQWHYLLQEILQEAMYIATPNLGQATHKT